MPIDQAGLNKLLSMVNPQNKLAALREYQNGLLKKLEQNTKGGKSGPPDDSDESNNVDTRHVIVELKSTNQQLQMAVFEEETRRLELERLKREEAMAKKYREREKVLARHERALHNASMSKLYSAYYKLPQVQGMVGAGMSLSFDGQAEKTDKSYSPNSLEGKFEEINRDLKEAVEYGIAAAEVARRRKNNQVKADIEEAAQHNKRIKKQKSKIK